MKKKLASILLAVMCVFALGFCALACGDDQLDGKWYMWVDGHQATTIAYEFDGGDITVSGIEAGDYTIDGKDVTINLIGGGKLKGKIVKDGIIELENGIGYFCREGKTPPSDSAE